MDNDWKTSWSSKWKKVFIWLSGYLSIIAFAIVGGYTVVKGNDEGCKKNGEIRPAYHPIVYGYRRIPLAL